MLREQMMFHRAGNGDRLGLFRLSHGRFTSVRKIMMKASTAAWFVAMGVVGLAQAGQVINVDFQPGSTGDAAASNYVGQGAISDPGNDIWNAVAPNTTGEFNGDFGTGGFLNFADNTYTSSLVDSTGTATPVTVVVNKAPPANPAESERCFALWATNPSVANLATNAVALMSDFLISRNEGFDSNLVTINNLTTGGIYNLVLYGAGDFASRNTMFIVGDRTKTTTGVPEVPHGLTEGQDYVVFNGVVANGGSIAVTYLNGGEHEEGNFNGFQLQEADPVNISTVKVSAVTGLSFTSVSDATYRLQYASNLLSQDWQTAPVGLIGTGGSMTAFDPDGFSTAKVYRVIQQ
jgi:hypothetical protein